MQRMVEGDKWELYIPSDLAYGDAGRPPTIPKKATLVFTMEIVKIKGATVPKADLWSIMRLGDRSKTFASHDMLAEARPKQNIVFSGKALWIWLEGSSGGFGRFGGRFYGAFVEVNNVIKHINNINNNLIVHVQNLGSWL